MPPPLLILSLLLFLLLPPPSHSTCPSLLPATTTRIIGGSPAPAPSHSFIASLINPFSSTCTASVLSPYWLLTARHCNPTNATFAYLNTPHSSTGTLIPINATFPYPTHFNRDPNDLTLIQLSQPVPPNVTFVKLNTNPLLPHPNSAVRALGFGRTLFAGPADGILRQVDIPTVGLPRCRTWLGPMLTGLLNGIDRRSICAGYRRGRCGVCQGDSGGPLVQMDADGRVVQVGISSRSLGCAWSDRPAVFVRASHFVEWMRDVGAVFETSDDALQVPVGEL